ncbi:hypothetical protein AB0D54_37980, partial [Streptomyces xanthophaeus]|uniref:hypothetical protein n=1 Tax=Streptomyces xanthophaeus TaxID=67385 RepID=UPI003433B190
ASADPRDGRFERRDAHQTVAQGKTFGKCGKRLIDRSGASILWAPGKGALGGVCRCNNVHMCAWCMARILAVRAANVQAAAEGLAAAGYGLHLGTSTLRHFSRQRYGSLRKTDRGGLVALLHDAWKGAYGSSGRQWRRFRDTYGVVGYERAYEDTYGTDTGFHLHFHTLWVTKSVLDDEVQVQFGRDMARMWADAVRGADGYNVSLSCDRPGCPCGGEGHGTDLRALNKSVDDATTAARYLYKDGDKGVAKIGLELSGSHFKDGRLGRLGPLQLGDAAAAELAELGRPGPYVAKYRERESGVHGVRKQYRTQNLNKLIVELGIKQDTRTESQITDDTQGLEPIAVIPASVWYRHIVRYKGRRLDLIKATEEGGAGAVRLLVESWGLTWGWDVRPVTPDGDVEVTEPVDAVPLVRRNAASEALAGWIQTRTEEEGALFSSSLVS